MLNGSYRQTVTEPSSLTLPPCSPIGLSQEARNGKKALLRDLIPATESSDSASFGGEDWRLKDSPLLTTNPQMKQQGPVRIREGVEITCFRLSGGEKWREDFRIQRTRTLQIQSVCVAIVLVNIQIQDIVVSRAHVKLTATRWPSS